MERVVSNIELSIHYRVWQILYQEGLWNDVVDQTSTLVTGDGVLPNTYQLDGFPFVFIGDDGKANSNGFNIKVAGVPLDPSTYQADYQAGQVVLTAAPASVPTISARCSVFRVLDAYPDDVWLEENNLPIIAIEIEAIDRSKAFAVGSGQRWEQVQSTIDILCRTKGERNDVLYTIQSQIQKCNLMDVSQHWILTEFNVPDIDFDPDAQFLGIMKPQKLLGTMIRPRRGGTDKEKFRGMVNFDIEQIS